MDTQMEQLVKNAPALRPKPLIPTCLKLPESLINELDNEYWDKGFSNRSAYIRFILSNR